MNLLAFVDCTLFGNISDESIGGPLQRTSIAYAKILQAINIANTYNNTTRSERLNAFKSSWVNKAEMLIFQEREGDGTGSAVKYSLDLMAEVNAAIAVND